MQVEKERRHSQETQDETTHARLPPHRVIGQTCKNSAFDDSRNTGDKPSHSEIIWFTPLPFGLKQPLSLPFSAKHTHTRTCTTLSLAMSINIYQRVKTVLSVSLIQPSQSAFRKNNFDWIGSNLNSIEQSCFWIEKRWLNEERQNFLTFISSRSEKNSPMISTTLR